MFGSPILTIFSLLKHQTCLSLCIVLLRILLPEVDLNAKKTDPNRAWAGLDDIHIHPNAVALFNIAVESRVGNGRNTLFWEDKWLMGYCLEDLAPVVVAAVPSRTRE